MNGVWGILTRLREPHSKSLVLCLVLGRDWEALAPGCQPGVVGGRFKSQQTSRQNVRQPPSSQRTHKPPEEAISRLSPRPPWAVCCDRGYKREASAYGGDIPFGVEYCGPTLWAFRCSACCLCAVATGSGSGQLSGSAPKTALLELQK